MATISRVKGIAVDRVIDEAVLGADRLRVLLDSMPAMIAYVDTHERFQFCNRAYLTAFGLNESEVLGMTIREVLGDAIYASLRPRIARALSGETVHHERTQQWPSGECSELTATYVPHFDESGRVLGLHAMLVDVTVRKSAEQSLRKSEATLRTVSDNLPALVAYVDANEIYQFANRTYENWFGVRPDQVVGRSIREVLGNDYAIVKPHIDKALSGARAEHERDVFINMRHRHLHNAYIPSIDADGRTVGFTVLATDISERKALEDELTHRAFHDSLTGLPNRALFEDRLHQALERSKRHRATLAVLYLDIDHFKTINDTLGHQVGDEVLRTFAGRLVQYVRTTDTVARLGGDEFVILMEEIRGEEDAVLIARKVLAAMQAGLKLGGAMVRATVSIGLAICKAGNYEADSLLARADTALYRAKAEGRNQWQAAG